MGIVDDNSFVHHNTKYDLNGKIMITALISISIVVFLVTILRLSTRCLIIRGQAQDRATSRNSRISTMTNASQVVPRSKNGLHPSLITSLPIFLYKKNDPHDDIIECSICLSIIEDGELVRVLPNCRHNFHAECIDKWFNCHSTCPICHTTPREGFVSRMTPSMAPMDGEETSSSGNIYSNKQNI